jgi:hypothetical protein
MLDVAFTALAATIVVAVPAIRLYLLVLPSCGSESAATRRRRHAGMAVLSAIVTVCYAWMPHLTAALLATAGLNLVCAFVAYLRAHLEEWLDEPEITHSPALEILLRHKPNHREDEHHDV